MKKQLQTLTALTLCTGLTLSPVYAYEKDETVYVTLKENGAIKSTTVSDHLKADGEKTISDTSDLKNIKNVNGDETFTQDGTTIVWNNEGHDIYYEGTTTKTLPLETTISYRLNGKKMKPSQMVGKKGDIEMTIKIKNTSRHEDLYTPFVVTVAAMIPTTHQQQFQITHGKVISNGKSNMLVAIMAPGLYESLDQPEALKDLDTVTITYHTESFETFPLYAIATPKLLSESDLNFENDLPNKLNTLQSASNQLVNGSGELAQGSQTLQTNYQQFDQGLSKLLDGTTTLKDQYQSLDDGIQALAKESQNLSQVSDLLGKLNELGSATSALDEGIEALKQAVQASTDPNSDTNQQLQALKQNLSTKQEELIQLQTSMTSLQADLKNRVGSLMQLNAQLAEVIKTTTDPEQTTALTTIQAGLGDQITLLTQNLTSLNDGMTLLQEKFQSIQTTLNELNTLESQITTATINQLNTAITQFTTGNQQLKQSFAFIQEQTAPLPEKINQLVLGTNQLSEGSTKVTQALATMNTSTTTLYQANSQINKAIGLIANGALTLQTGMNQFDKDGIQSLASLSTILENAGDKAERLIQLSKDYKTFTQGNDDINSDVKFIYTIQYSEKK